MHIDIRERQLHYLMAQMSLYTDQKLSAILILGKNSENLQYIIIFLQIFYLSKGA